MRFFFPSRVGLWLSKYVSHLQHGANVDAKDLSGYVKMTSAALEKELKSKNKKVLEKWVD